MVDHRLFLFTVELLRELTSYVFKIQKWLLGKKLGDSPRSIKSC